jgi:hypothetical protein
MMPFDLISRVSVVEMIIGIKSGFLGSFVVDDLLIDEVLDLGDLPLSVLVWTED